MVTDYRLIRSARSPSRTPGLFQISDQFQLAVVFQNDRHTADPPGLWYTPTLLLLSGQPLICSVYDSY